MFKAYLKLAKPGIVIGNLISATGGFLLASQGNIDWDGGALVALSISLIVASGCAVNNVIDRDIDAVMARTRNRPMVNGEIAIPLALLFATLLGVAGAGILYGTTGTVLPVVLMLVGYVIYVGLYSLCLKRKSVHGTLVGSLSGAMPPVVGYCAVSGKFDAAALLLLAIFSLWQMPHSYAVAIFRADDYRAAAIPVLPAVKGGQTAKRHIVMYISAFILATQLLALLGYVGWFYVWVALASGAYWLWVGMAGFTAEDERGWARELFFSSIAVVSALSIAMAIDSVPLH